MKHELPELPYSYDALEPHIDAKTMEIHHTKHHQGYVDKLNAALEKHPAFSEMTLKDLLADLDSVPEDIRTAVRNNGGGHYNHSLFWQILSPDGGGEPEGKIALAINDAFGDFESFKEKFDDAASGVFGSGWVWLILGVDNNLKITKTPLQDSPVMQREVPLLGLDVWEHAYYLNYQNKRADYISAWWNVVNWKQVEENYSRT